MTGIDEVENGPVEDPYTEKCSRTCSICGRPKFPSEMLAVDKGTSMECDACDKCAALCFYCGNVHLKADMTINPVDNMFQCAGCAKENADV